MDPRLLLYNDLKEVISTDVTDVAHIDLWNENVEFADEDAPWPRPAVFVEFGDITWEPIKTTGRTSCLRGSGELRLHIVTDWSAEAYASSFDIGERIWRALMRWRYDSQDTDYTVYYPSVTQTNHNHESLLENIDIFGVKYNKWLENNT